MRVLLVSPLLSSSLFLCQLFVIPPALHHPPPHLSLSIPVGGDPLLLSLITGPPQSLSLRLPHHHSIMQWLLLPFVVVVVVVVVPPAIHPTSSCS